MTIQPSLLDKKTIYLGVTTPKSKLKQDKQIEVLKRISLIAWTLFSSDLNIYKY